MKKLLYVLLIGMGVSAVNAQEVLSTISYNPSRSGDYSYLKVSDSATLRGGLKTDDLRVGVGSNGRVDITSSQNKDYQILNVVGEQDDVSIEMPNAEFNITNGLISGGTIEFGGANVQSTINNITSAANSLMYANTTQAVSLNIKGPESVDNVVELNNSDNNKAKDTTGFFLAGYDIPNPTKDHVTNDGINMGVTLGTSCQLSWVPRKTNEATPKEVYVLALNNCSGTTDPTDNGGTGTCKKWSKKAVSAGELYIAYARKKNYNTAPSSNVCYTFGGHPDVSKDASCTGYYEETPVPTNNLFYNVVSIKEGEYDWDGWGKPEASYFCFYSWSSCVQDKCVEY